jgi:hypothetical protein
MRKLLIIFIANLALGNAFGQSLNPNQHLYIMAKFLDSAKLTKDVIESKEIASIYKNLAKKNDYVNYEYYFSVSKDGKVTPKLYPENAILKQFFSKFNTYGWLPACKKKSAAKLNSQGTFTLTISPVNKLIIAVVDVSAGESNKSFGTGTVFRKEFKR